jgi:hypothetical protein
MPTDELKQERTKKIRVLLARWKKRQRSKQKELPFTKPKDAFQYHSVNYSEKTLS